MLLTFVRVVLGFYLSFPLDARSLTIGLGMFKNFFSQHKYLLIGAVVAVACFAMLACQFTGKIVEPGATATAPAEVHKYTLDELDAKAAAAQAEFDKRADAIHGEQNAAVAATQSATAPADIAAAQAAKDKSLSDAKALATDIDAFNAAMDQAYTQIARKQQMFATMVQALGGVARTAAQGAVDPVSLIGTGLTLATSLMGLGALGDSRAKSKVINKLQTPPTA